ncbi:MAG: proline racemase family protein [Candidatus Hodarchaeota archaeon]
MKLDKIKNWTPPEHWRRISTLDAHTAGEPLRIIIDGLPELPGDTILDRRRYFKENLDDLRSTLMWEPRGHREMYGCVITPPVSPEADIGVLFMHNEGYSTMCGHGIIGLASVVVETGMFPAKEPDTIIRIDTPAGLVTAHVKVDKGQIQSVYFHNVPSFVLALDETVDVSGLGKISYDIAFGGAFYAFVQAEEVGLTLAPEEHKTIVETGMAIKHAVMKKRSIVHPFEEDLNFLYGTIFIGSSTTTGVDDRNVCIFAEGQVDRCSTGTGVSGRMAIHYARGEIGIDQPMVIESIIGTTFRTRIVEVTTFGKYTAVIPEVEGSAYITGRHEFFIDPDDPLKKGFIL